MVCQFCCNRMFVVFPQGNVQHACLGLSHHKIKMIRNKWYASRENAKSDSPGRSQYQFGVWNTSGVWNTAATWSWNRKLLLCKKTKGFVWVMLELMAWLPLLGLCLSPHFCFWRLTDHFFCRSLVVCVFSVWWSVCLQSGGLCAFSPVVCVSLSPLPSADGLLSFSSLLADWR